MSYKYKIEYINQLKLRLIQLNFKDIFERANLLPIEKREQRLLEYKIYNLENCLMGHFENLIEYNGFLVEC